MTFHSETIKSALTMQQVALHYGFRPNSAGFIKCPFHNDKTASVKLYPGTRGFHCFGCHIGGSVIDFVMKLLSLSFKDACERLNEDFRLGLDMDAPVDKRAVAQYKAAQDKKNRKHNKFLKSYREKSDEHQRLFSAFINKAPQPDDDIWDEEFCEALAKLPELEEWFDRAQVYENKLMKGDL
jgi:DNA primase